MPTPRASSTPVCSHCDDTHYVPAPEDRSGPFGDGKYMCQWCPTPCQKCRAGGNGPYCEKTPCACECHERRRQAHAKSAAQRLVNSTLVSHLPEICESLGIDLRKLDVEKVAREVAEFLRGLAKE